MEKFEKYIYKVGREVLMSKSEKENIKARLKKEIILPVKNTNIFPYSNFLFIFKRNNIASLALVTLFFVGGTVSALAEKSIPGDFLYSFKIGINEEVLGWFSVTDYMKAEWSVRLADRRLMEMEALDWGGSERLTQEEMEAFNKTVLSRLKEAEEDTRKYAEFDTEKEVTSAVSSDINTETSIEPSETNTFMLNYENEAVSSEQNMMVEKDDPDLSILEGLKSRLYDFRQSVHLVMAKAGNRDGRLLRLEARALVLYKDILDANLADLGDSESSIVIITKSISEMEHDLEEIIEESDYPKLNSDENVNKSITDMDKDTKGSVKDAGDVIWLKEDEVERGEEKNNINAENKELLDII